MSFCKARSANAMPDRRFAGTEATDAPTFPQNPLSATDCQYAAFSYAFFALFCDCAYALRLLISSSE